MRIPSLVLMSTLMMVPQLATAGTNGAQCAPTDGKVHSIKLVENSAELLRMATVDGNPVAIAPGGRIIDLGFPIVGQPAPPAPPLAALDISSFPPAPGSGPIDKGSDFINCMIVGGINELALVLSDSPFSPSTGPEGPDTEIVKIDPPSGTIILEIDSDPEVDMPEPGSLSGLIPAIGTFAAFVFTGAHRFRRLRESQ